MLAKGRRALPAWVKWLASSRSIRAAKRPLATRAPWGLISSACLRSRTFRARRLDHLRCRRSAIQVEEVEIGKAAKVLAIKRCQGDITTTPEESSVICIDEIDIALNVAEQGFKEQFLC